MLEVNHLIVNSTYTFCGLIEDEILLLTLKDILIKDEKLLLGDLFIYFILCSQIYKDTNSN